MTSEKPKEWTLIGPDVGVWAGEISPVASGPTLGANVCVAVIEKSHADSLERKLKRAMEALNHCSTVFECGKYCDGVIKDIEEMK